MTSLAEELMGNFAFPSGVPRKVNNLHLDEPIGYHEERIARKRELERLCWKGLVVDKRSKEEMAEELGLGALTVHRYMRDYERRMHHATGR